MYADDTQVYLSFSHSDINNIIYVLELCIADLKTWMLHHFLELNNEKTEIVLIGSKHNLKLMSSISVSINGIVITSYDKVKNLGTVFDNEMSMQAFVSAKCQCALYHLRSIARIRKYLDQDATRSLIQAFVISRIDYANSLLFGINKKLLKII